MYGLVPVGDKTEPLQAALKSNSTRDFTQPSSHIMMFSGLMSLWHILREWQ
jgi:hypothetical protein